ncbi:MAG: hypothetical protein WD767_19850 [Alphaproteobacteria bacterium]
MGIASVPVNSTAQIGVTCFAEFAAIDSHNAGPTSALHKAPRNASARMVSRPSRRQSSPLFRQPRRHQGKNALPASPAPPHQSANEIRNADDGPVPQQLRHTLPSAQAKRRQHEQFRQGQRAALATPAISIRSAIFAGD